MWTHANAHTQTHGHTDTHTHTHTHTHPGSHTQVAIEPYAAALFDVDPRMLRLIATHRARALQASLSGFCSPY